MARIIFEFSIPVAFFSIGVYFIIRDICRILKGGRTEALIVMNEKSPMGGSLNFPSLVYDVDGVTYGVTVMSRGRMFREYRAGKDVKIYYSLKNPRKLTMRKGLLPFWFMMAFLAYLGVYIFVVGLNYTFGT